MAAPIGYTVRIDRTHTGDEWKAKIGRDESGKKEIVFFLRTDKPGLMQKLKDMKNNVTNGKQTAQKYLTGMFKMESGAILVMKISTPPPSTLPKAVAILENHFNRFEQAQFKNFMQENKESLRNPDADGVPIPFSFNPGKDKL